MSDVITYNTEIVRKFHYDGLKDTVVEALIQISKEDPRMVRFVNEEGAPITTSFMHGKLFDTEIDAALHMQYFRQKRGNRAVKQGDLE